MSEPQQSDPQNRKPNNANDNGDDNGNNSGGRNSSIRNAFIYAALAYGLVSIFSPNDNEPQAEQLSYSEFIDAAESGQYTDVRIQGQYMQGESESGEFFVTYIPNGENPVDRLQDVEVNISAIPEPSPGLLPSILFSFGPIALLIGAWLWLMRRQSNIAGGMLGRAGGSKAKLLTENDRIVTFDDVAGIDEVKSELEEIVEFLRNPERFTRVGGKVPTGVLLSGAPGTGKTLTARAVAGEAGVPFFTISGSDFVEMFVGLGASRVRDMFKEAKKNAPCIIFIDEIDAVGRSRGAGYGGGNDEREQTLNQLLVEMDGFEDNQGVIVIAATNRPDVLDSALKRPGRFDRQITVPLPDVKGREAILKVHTRRSPLAADVDLTNIAKGTPGFSGADLMNLANEAALSAARRNATQLTQYDFDSAKDRIMLGGERRSLAMSEHEKTLTAYHEAGHALVALNMKASDPIHKATIIPRGQALGMVMRLPENDRVSMSKEQLEADLAVAMGGRLAEEIIFGTNKITTGAASDIQMITMIAKKMVTEWGLSEKVGMIRYKDQNPGGFPEPREISEETAKLIDAEIKAVVDNAHNTARTILTEQKETLERIAEALMKFETLSGAELQAVFEGKELEKTSLTKPADDPHAVLKARMEEKAPHWGTTNTQRRKRPNAKSSITSVPRVPKTPK